MASTWSTPVLDLGSLLVAVERERPDVVVTDIRMPPSDTDEGLQLAAQLRRTHPSVGVVVLSQFAERQRTERSAAGELTPRELEILAYVARGHSNQAIADELVLTERAVEKHINAIFLKLNLSQAEDVSRRVKAALIYLAARGDG